MIQFILLPLMVVLAAAMFFFFVQRPLFLLYNRKLIKTPIPKSDWHEILKRGLHTDLIVACYIGNIACILMISYAITPKFDLMNALFWYYCIIGFIVSLLVVSDTALYSFWQFKIDRSVLMYLKSPKAAFASVTTGYLLLAFGVVALVWAIFVGILSACTLWLEPFAPSGVWMWVLTVVVYLAIRASMILTIRGLGRRPNNPSLTYYSKTLSYNHTALNPMYNFIYSLSVKVNFKDQFRTFKSEECDRIYAPLFPLEGKPQVELLNTKRPNVVMIIWESCGARFVESLGGQPNVTPNIDRLAKEGVMFTRCDAGSWRTNHGIVCILSGYLAQPTTTVIRMAKKLPNLPALPNRFKELGYETTLLHGGDLTVFHKSDYYLTIGHDRLVSQPDFPASMPTCKWGIHDGEMFDWLYDDIQEKQARGAKFFSTFQTLSSHETWEVPYTRLKDQPVANSFAYVDDCFGRFIDRLKASPAWKDLLVICVADHGCNDGTPMGRDQYVHIPLLMLGGAVKEPRRIDTLMSQTDLAATLLGQLDLPHKDFTFSRDVLADTYQKHFSFHDYQNGFFVRDERGFTDYDNETKQVITGNDDEREAMGKAILQKLYEDLDKR